MDTAVASPEQHDVDEHDGPGFPTREEIDAAHERNGTVPPPLVGNVDDPPEQHPTADDDEPSQDRDEIVLDAGGQLGWSVGGKKPTESSVRLTGGAFKVNGQLDKGSTRQYVIAARTRVVAFDDKTDSKTDQVIDCERKHTGRITSATLVPEGYRVAIVPDTDTVIDGELDLQ